MGQGISEDALKEFAVDFSEDIRAASSGSGEIYTKSIKQTGR